MTETFLIPGVLDDRGNLRWIEKPTIPFDVKRVFYISDSSGQRGGHAHKKCHQFIVSAIGDTRIELEFGDKVETLILEKNHGLYIPPLIWCTLWIQHGGVCIVLASDTYDENDYIRDFGKFLDEVGL